MEPLPPVQYAKGGDVHIAFTQHGPSVGEDVVLTNGATSTMESYWNNGVVAAIAEHARVTWYDKRGLGLSDGVANFSFEERMDDIRAVMDEAGIQSAHLGGISEGGPLSILFAATYPERVKSLSLYATYPAAMRKPGYPHGLDMSLGEYSQFVDRVVDAYTGHVDAVRWLLEMVMPTYATNPDYVKAASFKMAGSPTAVRLIWEHMYEVDVRHVLQSIQVPTTIVHKTGDRLCPVEGGRYLAEHIAGAKMVEIPGDDHSALEPIPEWIDAFVDNINRAKVSNHIDVSRRLATVLFTDIVDSTPTAAQAGDKAWTNILDRHDSTSQQIIDDYEGQLIKTTGDGVLATFDGPSRAVACATALHLAMAELDVPIRAGLHTGEIEIRDNDIAGLGVHIASRVAGLADSGETLVSTTVKDLVVGAGFDFEDRGNHPLKGIEGDWHCFSLRTPA
jgi:class 3 adenylate cyclase/pimeloyl-ACP methyl ester carboxylesterase